MSLNSQYLTPDQVDALQELMNIGVGRAVSALSDLLESPVQLKVPSIKIIRMADLQEELEIVGHSEIATVNVDFSGPLNGSTLLMFPEDTVAQLVTVFAGDEEDNASLDSSRVETLTEIGNIVLNGLMGTIANLIKCHVEYSVPHYKKIDPTDLFEVPEADHDRLVIFTHATLEVAMNFSGERVPAEGGIVMVLGINGVDALITALNDMIPAEELTT